MFLPPSPRRAFLFAALCSLGLSLGSTSAAWAGFLERGSFGSGQLSRPVGVAVDESNGDVYVGNLSAGSYKFDSSGHVFSPPSPFGIGSGHYSGAAVNPVNGDVYVVDAGNQEIQTYDPASGVEFSSFSIAGSANLFSFTVVPIATDAAGNVYLPNAPNNEVQKFDSAGNLLLTITGSGASAPSAPSGVAVDGSGNVWVADAGNGRIEEFDASGAFVTAIPSAGVQAVALDSAGDVFASDNGGSGSHVVEYSSAGVQLDDFGLGTIGTSSIGAPNGVAVDNTSGFVYVADGGNNVVWIFAPGVPPELTYPSGRVTGVTASEATLHGEVNPRGNEVSCHFEYGTSTAYEHTVPCQPELVGAGSKPVPESVTISGLQANTEYHFRVVASGNFTGADETFTTSQAPPFVFASSVLASNVTQSDVLFNATVNPQHLDTHYYFNYGQHPFGDLSTCVPPGSVSYASTPGAPVDIGTAHSISEEAAGLAVSTDLGGATVVLHPGMESRALVPNTVYHVQVVAENAAGVSCEPEATFITLPPDPALSTGGAFALTQTAAGLSGSVTPGSVGPNSDTTWYFQYGTDTRYGAGSAPAAPGDAGGGTSAVAVSTAVQGLAPNTTYHYRLVASNANHDPAAAPQIAHGADRTFATLPPEPLLAAPSEPTETAVTLSGQVNPGGHDVRYSFQYGVSSAYGQSTPLTDAGEGSTLVPASASLAGLTPGVTYHYRLLATGAGGESYSPGATFTLYARAREPSGNPFPLGRTAAAPFPSFPPLGTPTFPPQPSEVAPPPHRQLTNAQRLTKALRACKKIKAKRRRSACEQAARKAHIAKASRPNTVVTAWGRS